MLNLLQDSSWAGIDIPDLDVYLDNPKKELVNYKRGISIHVKKFGNMTLAKP